MIEPSKDANGEPHAQDISERTSREEQSFEAKDERFLPTLNHGQSLQSFYCARESKKEGEKKRNHLCLLIHLYIVAVSVCNDLIAISKKNRGR